MAITMVGTMVEAIIMVGTIVEAITMDGTGADITDGVERGSIPDEREHPDEVNEESSKGEARKIIEEYANSLRELIKDMHQRFS